MTSDTIAYHLPMVIISIRQRFPKVCGRRYRSPHLWVAASTPSRSRPRQTRRSARQRRTVKPSLACRLDLALRHACEGDGGGGGSRTSRVGAPSSPAPTPGSEFTRSHSHAEGYRLVCCCVSRIERSAHISPGNISVPVMFASSGPPD